MGSNRVCKELVTQQLIIIEGYLLKYFHGSVINSSGLKINHVFSEIRMTLRSHTQTCKLNLNAVSSNLIFMINTSIHTLTPEVIN